MSGRRKSSSNVLKLRFLSSYVTLTVLPPQSLLEQIEMQESWKSFLPEGYDHKIRGPRSLVMASEYNRRGKGKWIVETMGLNPQVMFHGKSKPIIHSLQSIFTGFITIANTNTKIVCQVDERAAATFWSYTPIFLLSSLLLIVHSSSPQSGQL